jgi:hypothetical protein
MLNVIPAKAGISKKVFTDDEDRLAVRFLIALHCVSFVRNDAILAVV